MYIDTYCFSADQTFTSSSKPQIEYLLDLLQQKFHKISVWETDIPGDEVIDSSDILT